MRQPKYRVLLPAIQAVAAIVFGGVGILQRNAILRRPFLDSQTSAETTARFHVWPLPLKFAMVNNLPALVPVSVVGWPLAKLWPGMPVSVGVALLVCSVYGTWYLIGRSLDRALIPSRKINLGLLMLGLASVAAIFTPGYVGFMYSGILLWVVSAIMMSLSAAR